jgi:hypothetical protein
MVTYGREEESQIEYEDTRSKIETLHTDEGLTALAIGAGSSTVIDEIIDRAKRTIVNSPVSSATGIRECVVQSNQQIIQESVENQALSPLGYSLSDLKDPDVDVPDHIQNAIFQQAAEIRKRFEGTRIIIACVSDDESKIYQIMGADYINQSGRGNAVIGSGSRSAQLTFIRRGYDPNMGVESAFYLVLDAKNQAEERQGVGKRMDFAVMGPDSIKHIGGRDVEQELRNTLGDIEDELRTRRKEIINRKDLIDFE